MKPKFTDSARYPRGYVRSDATDVAKTFERARRALETQRAVTGRKVTPIKKAEK